MNPAVLSPEDFASRHPAIHERIEPAVIGPSVYVYDEDVNLDGDWSIDEARPCGTRGLDVFLGDLTIKGDFANYSSGYGRATFVQGALKAHNLIGGGAFIYLGETEIEGLVLGHYNDGILHGGALSAKLFINSDHDTYFTSQNVELGFDGFGLMEGVTLSGERVDPYSSYEEGREVETFVRGPLADFFKGTEWYSFWTDSKGDWREIRGVPPAERPDLQAEDIQIDWVGWACNAVSTSNQPVSPAVTALVDLARVNLRPGAPEDLQ